MVQVGKVDTAKFSNYRLRNSTRCLCTLNFLKKHWKQKINIRHNAKFLWRHYAIHVKTLKTSSFWWNKSTFRGMLKYYNSQNQSINNWELLQGGGPNFESCQCLMTLKWAWVKLAWTLCILNVVHRCKALHNDFSQNIMLHFSLSNLLIVYIEVRDWGEVGRFK